MILFTSVLMMATFIFTILLASTPIILGVNILLIAMILAMIFASYISSWFAFMLFLIYIGGMLVMFAYFLAITPNQHTSSIINIPMTFMSLITLYIMSNLFNMKTYIVNEFSNNFSFIYIFYNLIILILFAMILLFAMVIVVKLTFRSKGPLRPFM
uniref:NADH dehydrogenase subunit 6 n=1 Tax=Drawida ghilarovi TaxID=994964 RepID=UPI0021B5A8A4|nr:NADH dehydrogenase subunit 6 [Drawida ghilarovi]UIX22930.1 NADH dehydrogenase subunit 6 [Drawida ghilarovi]UIX22943.1 NADH dehydrogenase subunit 6 [Drawida ghilarovi]